jgi:hypothetical protein
MTNEERESLKYKICISGAAETAHCGEDSFADAEALGREIALHGAVLMDGATTGFPYWAAKGAKQAGGLVMGVSPASSLYEHKEVYKLPTDYHDSIFYTGVRYTMRNLWLIRMSDAVVFGCGRIGTINEFTDAFEDRKPLGILKGSWDTAQLFEEIIEKSHRGAEIKDHVVIESNPKILIEKLIEIIKRDEASKERMFM